MTGQLPISEASVRLRPLVRRVSQDRGRVTIAEQGGPAAVLISFEELAELEEALALTDYRNAPSNGTLRTTSGGQARSRLGLSRE